MKGYESGRGSELDSSLRVRLVMCSMTAQEVRGDHYIENGTRTSLFFSVQLSKYYTCNSYGKGRGNPSKTATLTLCVHTSPVEPVAPDAMP
jgi:hypothetical protein